MKARKQCPCRFLVWCCGRRDVARRHVRRHVGDGHRGPDRYISRRRRAVRHGAVESRYAVAERRRRLRI